MKKQQTDKSLNNKRLKISSINARNTCQTTSLSNTRNIKIFLIILLISLPFWYGINALENALENFFFWEKTKDMKIVTEISQPLTDYSSSKPLRDWNIEDLEIQAKSAISIQNEKNGTRKTLFRKAENEILPIASIAKLMTALIVIENYELNRLITINEEIVSQVGDTGELQIGQNLTVKELLYISLMESSNDAAYALAVGYDEIEEKEFVELMNSKAENLELKNTYFVNCTGLDSDDSALCENYSTARDLARLTEALLQKPLILDILSTPEFELYLPNGVLHHKLKNTNILLEEIPSIIGGKTGWTPKAQECLLLILKNPKTENKYIINVILGSQDRFGEMKKLTEWIYKAYRF